MTVAAPGLMVRNVEQKVVASVRSTIEKYGPVA